jgi:F-type H+-transporting ATPase subunit gamma
VEAPGVAKVTDAAPSCVWLAFVHRSLQEGLASELAARMNAMNNATDNAKELKKVREVDGC